MPESKSEPLWDLMGLLFKAHPWHGVPIGDEMPQVLTAYIEVVPSDTIKYEIDKQSGLLKVDRPQRYSNVCPALYGLVPQTYCAEKVAEFSAERAGKGRIEGDHDPLDICVLSEKTFSRGDFLVEVIPIGGLRMIDGNEADDKIIAVLKGDASYGDWREIESSPASLVERLKHYFLTYKSSPDDSATTCEITHVYGREEAYEVIRRSHDDYATHFGNLEDMLTALRG
ncbi:MAG: inorganic pyrophosphatase [Candidatus Sumerlaeota bacterium]|nr:inorganic pyrophosphatase [Candidatus Sumerlaeota bacterium]